MKILVMYPHGAIGAAWSCTQGISTTLTRMGYEVMDYPVAVLSSAPKIPNSKIMQDVDAVIISGLEHLYPSLKAGKFKADFVPTAAIYHESMTREDINYDVNSMWQYADHHFFPSAYDAKAFGGEFLPFGVDTEIFKPLILPRIHATGFVGSMYPKRQKYVNDANLQLNYLNADPVIKDGKLDLEASTHRLAVAYNQVSVFVNLPHLSRLLVTKVYEVMACGTFLFTPLLEDIGASNGGAFVHTGHLEYYKESEPDVLKKRIKEVLLDHDYRTKIAAQGMREVHTHHRLDQRLKTVVDKLGISPKLPYKYEED